MCKYSLNNIRILSEDSSRSIDLCSLKNNSIIKAFHQIYHFITKFFFLLDYTISIFFQQDLLAVAQTSRLLRGRATVRTTKKRIVYPFSIKYYLGLFNGRIGSITHGGDVQAGLPLPVPLLEELLHDPVAPLPVELQGLGGVGQVGTVDHVLQDPNTTILCSITLDIIKVY